MHKHLPVVRTDTALTVGAPMASARTACPQCHGSGVVDLMDLLYSPQVDYLRCSSCGCWWTVPKNKDGPATRCSFGTPANPKMAGA